MNQIPPPYDVDTLAGRAMAVGTSTPWAIGTTSDVKYYSDVPDYNAGIETLFYLDRSDGTWIVFGGQSVNGQVGSSNYADRSTDFFACFGGIVRPVQIVA